ncbi:hypothetical protein Tco_0265054 [Tanacetum coccineum]
MNYLQPEWLKYVTSVRLAKDLTKAPYDDLFDYLQQYEKISIASRAKKLVKTHAPFALVAYTSSSSRSPHAYYATHPSVILLQKTTEFVHLQTQEIKQLCKLTELNIQSINVGNDGRIARRSYNVQEEYVKSSTVQKETGNVQRNLLTTSSGNGTNV